MSTRSIAVALVAVAVCASAGWSGENDHGWSDQRQSGDKQIRNTEQSDETVWDRYDRTRSREAFSARWDRPQTRGFKSSFRSRMKNHFDSDNNGKLSFDERAAAREAQQRSDRSFDRAPHTVQPAVRTDSIFDRFDVDGDGELSSEERQTARGQFREKWNHADRSDPARTGRLGRFEGQLRHDFGKRNTAFGESFRQKFDADGDGTLSHNERSRLHAAIQQRRDTGRWGNGELTPQQRLMDRFDHNNDGDIDPTEREAARQIFQHRLQQGNDRSFGGHFERRFNRYNDRVPQRHSDIRQRIHEQHDVDGDGWLNEDEREQARTAVQTWRRNESPRSERINRRHDRRQSRSSNKR